MTPVLPIRGRCSAKISNRVARKYALSDTLEANSVYMHSGLQKESLIASASPPIGG